MSPDDLTTGKTGKNSPLQTHPELFPKSLSVIVVRRSIGVWQVGRTGSQPFGGLASLEWVVWP